MKPLTILVLFVALGLWIGRAAGTGGVQEPSYAPPASLPAGALEILAARPFVVDEPFVHEWRAEKPLVTAGYLLALKADPDLARTRQTYEPVLYVGEQTAERCSTQIEGGVMIVLVPAALDAQGNVDLDLASVPIWFGGLELPERVDAARIAAELARARSLGLGTPQHAAGLRLRFGPDEAIRARSRWALQPYVDDWIARYGVF
jgi:hypothetical protein